MAEQQMLIALRDLLAIMTQRKASDLYITEGAAPSIKIEGVLSPIGNRKLTAQDCEAFIKAVLTESGWASFVNSKEANVPLDFAELGRYRVNVFRQRGVCGMVIRLIRARIPSVEECGLPAVVKQLALRKRGLILVVGGTGVGKSTTMAAMIDYRNQNSRGHIVTIEDPIEFIHEHKNCIVTQREVGIDTDTLENGLKNSLRQAPDLIVIGEIRDRETMEAAITFAETGHLCIATLHSNSATQAMERVMNFFPAERHKQIYMQLSMNLRATISQRLIPSVDGGRVPAVEILVDSPRIKDLILHGQIFELAEAIEKSSQMEMQTFDQALYELHVKGRISLDDALKNADSANNLRLRVKLEGGAKSAPRPPDTKSPAK
jgi:twitching motility protein PilU